MQVGGSKDERLVRGCTTKMSSCQKFMTCDEANVTDHKIHLLPGTMHESHVVRPRTPVNPEMASRAMCIVDEDEQPVRVPQ